jgi:hypothetical protein
VGSGTDISDDTNVGLAETHTFEDLIPDTLYTFHATASDGSGNESDPSNVVTKYMGEGYVGGEITVNWTTPDMNDITDTCFFDTNDNKIFQSFASNIPGIPHTVIIPTPETQCIFIRLKRGAGVESDSNTVCWTELNRDLYFNWP